MLSSTEYIKVFNELLNADELSCEDIRQEIDRLIFETPISFQQIRFDFVVRTSVLKPGEICTNVSRCSYNPDSKGIPLQRCNYAQQQVFYASVPGGMTNLSDGAQSSFMETCFDQIKSDPEFYHRFVVSTRWKFKKTPWVWVLPFNCDSKALNLNFEFLFNQFNTVLKEQSIDEFQYINLLKKAEFLSSLYCSKEKKKSVYRLTATFHNEICRIFNLQNDEKLQGLIYPSANTNGEGMNLVLDKDFIVPENIVCDHAVLYNFKRNPRNSSEISFLPIASSDIAPNGDINFKPLAY